MNRLRHRHLGKMLDAWVDRELHTTSIGATVGRHVAECWSCSAAADTTRLIKATLGGRRRPQVAEKRLRRFVERLVAR